MNINGESKQLERLNKITNLSNVLSKLSGTLERQLGKGDQQEQKDTRYFI